MADFFGRLRVWPEFAHIDGSQEKQVALVQQLIARVGKAYADGELKLPGEIRRDEVTSTGSLDASDESCHVTVLHIALRKEEKKKE